MLSVAFYLDEWSDRRQYSKVKGIKIGHKKFHPSVYGWEGMCLSLCLSLCLSVQI